MPGLNHVQAVAALNAAGATSGTSYTGVGGSGVGWQSVPMDIINKALGPATGLLDAAGHLTAVLDLSKAGVPTKRLSVRFKLQLPSAALLAQGAAGFTIFQIGATGIVGTITLQYKPIQGAGTKNPHALIARVVTGTLEDRYCSVSPTRSGLLIMVYLEYNGTELTLIADQSSDSYAGSTEIVPAGGGYGATSAMIIGCNTGVISNGKLDGLYFDDVNIYTSSQLAGLSQTKTEFPYFLWDSVKSGVIAVVPVGTDKPTGGYFTFIDRGYSAGHRPATLNLSSTGALAGIQFFVNERQVPLTGFSGTSALALVSYLTGLVAGLPFAFDGKTEYMKFVLVSGNTVQAYHVAGVQQGQLSFALRFSATSGPSVGEGDWGNTVPVLGKIPPPFLLPHTGEPNAGVSILGANAAITTPKSIQVSKRDDAVRTVGKIIGSVKNRPGSRAALQILQPSNFFGSSKAPFPKNSMIYGDPNKLSTQFPNKKNYSYGVVWETYLNISPPDVAIRTAPKNRSRQGDHFAAFSLDIPVGMTLRGLNLNFCGAPPAYKGNTLGGTPGVSYDWGYGFQKFPQMLTGSGDYTVLFQLLIAVDDYANIWQPVPSLGVDAIKVQGANLWKTIEFKQVDYDLLLDADGKHLLNGSRRVHFKFVLANSLTSVRVQGLGYRIQTTSKK